MLVVQSIVIYSKWQR